MCGFRNMPCRDQSGGRLKWFPAVARGHLQWLTVVARVKQCLSFGFKALAIYQANLIKSQASPAIRTRALVAPSCRTRKAKLVFCFSLIFSVVAVMALPSKAEALPAFAKKYSAPCGLCHSSWPKLNRVGWQFKVNGYQLPGSRDGAKAGKVSPAFDLNLDTGNADPPLSFRLGGGIDFYRPKTTPEGEATPDNLACCTRPNVLKLYLAGTVGTDLGYFVSYPLADREVGQAFIRYVNLFGQGTLGLDVGAFRTADSDAVTPGRDWFGEPDVAFYGNSGTADGDQGMTAGYVDTGIRFFGNPTDNPFSYDLLYVSGARAAGSAGYGKGYAMGAMGRMDVGHFSGSIRYWTSESSELTFDFSNEGGGVFKGGSAEPDEMTQDYILALKYETDKWQMEFVYDLNMFKMNPRSGDIDPTLTYSRDSVTRNGASIAAIFRVNALITTGLRYGFSTVSAYDYWLNGQKDMFTAANAAKFEFRLDFTPVQNAKLGLQYTLDMSNENGRRDATGKVYDLQNRLFLLWDWAI